MVANPVYANHDVAEPAEPKRPKKRRRVEPEVVDTPIDDDEQEKPPKDALDHETALNLARKSPTPPTALPSFPLPSRPDAPSKSTLALQGLDKALIEAELVDPLRTIPLEGDADAVSLISDKTRRRLKDLGISTMFAGQSSNYSSPPTELIKPVRWNSANRRNSFLTRRQHSTVAISPLQPT